jgi:hypothetical protein
VKGVPLLLAFLYHARKSLETRKFQHDFAVGTVWPTDNRLVRLKPILFEKQI